jgi:hypothetical protein
MEVLLFQNLIRFLDFHWGFLIVALGIELLIYIYNFLTKQDPDNEYFKKVYRKKLFTRITIYSFITLLIYSLNFLNILVISFIFIGIMVYAVIRNQKTWKEMEFGISLIRESKIDQNNLVKINENKEGKIEKLEITTLTLKTDDKTLYTMPYSEVKSIEVFGNKRLLRGSLVLNFREDPKKAKEHLENLITKLNEMFEEDFKDKADHFKVKGIVDTNSSYHGMLYEIEAYVDTDQFEKISLVVKYELAEMAYKNHLKMAETNVYYRTRMSNQ